MTSIINLQYRELVNKLKLWNDAYYLKDNPEVDDAVFDAHMQELIALEKKYPELISEDSPTQYAGVRELPTKFSKVTHLIPMISLANAFGSQDILEWEDRINRIIGQETKREYIFELKIDGLSIAIDYNHGQIIKAATRGNGKVGEDVTVNIKTIKTLPQKIDYQDPISIRGEVFINKTDFVKINQEQESKGLDIYANPRNTASGSLRQLDPKITQQRNLDAIFYSLFPFNSLDQDFNQEIPPQTFTTHSQALQKLDNLGFKTNKLYNAVCDDISEVISLYEYWEKQKNSLDFMIDGAVVKINQHALQSTLGATAKSPRWALALKFQAEEAETQIESVDLEVGRLGTITPVANLSPVQLAGTTVKRASLHNFDQINKLQVKLKDWVLVRKAGEIIPEVVSVNLTKRPQDAQNIEVPKCCPACKSEIERIEVAYYCTNIATCPVQVQRRIEHWCSKAAMDISGVGPSLIKSLLDNGLIKDALDLYSLKEEDLIPLERMAEKSARNAIDSINQSRDKAFDRLLYAFGIKHIGTNTAALITDYYSDLVNLEKEIIDNHGTDLIKVDGIGSKVIASLQDFFVSETYKTFKDALQKNPQLLNIQTKEVKKVSEKFLGKTFVITGTLGESRSHFEQLIKDNGGKVSSSVSKKTSFLLCGQDPGSKKQKALELEVPVIDENQFYNLISQ